MDNQRLRKLARVFAGVVFLVALAINVKVTLDDPFLMLTEGVLAQSSSFSSCSTVSVSEAVRDKSRNEKTGIKVELIEIRKIKKCAILWFSGIPLKICWFEEEKFLLGIACKCAPGTEQDYCLN